MRGAIFLCEKNGRFVNVLREGETYRGCYSWPTQPRGSPDRNSTMTLPTERFASFQAFLTILERASGLQMGKGKVRFVMTISKAFLVVSYR